jgi:hypothetical protein
MRLWPTTIEGLATVIAWVGPVGLFGPTHGSSVAGSTFDHDYVEGRRRLPDDAA